MGLFILVSLVASARGPGCGRCLFLLLPGCRPVLIGRVASWPVCGVRFWLSIICPVCGLVFWWVCRLANVDFVSG